MAHDFLNYLHNKDLITGQQSEEVLSLLEFKTTGAVKDNLFFMYFYQLTSEQIKHINDVLRNDFSRSFEEVAKELGYIHEEITVDHESDEMILLECAQSLVNLRFMDAEKVYDELNIYKTGAFLENNVINLEGGNLIPDFIDQYLTIVSDRLRETYDLNVTYNEIEVLTYFEDEMFIIQNLKAETEENCLLTAISSTFDNLKIVARNLHNIMSGRLPLGTFEGAKEDVIDLFCETLNHINGGCTYRFNLDFDLDMPSCVENSVLKSPKIYKAGLDINSYNVNLCIASGTEYNFEEVGL